MIQGFGPRLRSDRYAYVVTPFVAGIICLVVGFVVPRFHSEVSLVIFLICFLFAFAAFIVGVDRMERSREPMKVPNAWIPGLQRHGITGVVFHGWRYRVDSAPGLTGSFRSMLNRPPDENWLHIPHAALTISDEDGFEILLNHVCDDHGCSMVCLLIIPAVGVLLWRNGTSPEQAFVSGLVAFQLGLFLWEVACQLRFRWLVRHLSAAAN